MPVRSSGELADYRATVRSTVACPTCGAERGEKCHGGSRQQRVSNHRDRNVAAWEAEHAPTNAGSPAVRPAERTGPCPAGCESGWHFSTTSGATAVTPCITCQPHLSYLT